MKKREYDVLVSRCGEFEQELYSTHELIIALIIAKFNNKFDILKLRRAYFCE